MRRPWHIWIAFGLCLAVVLGAMGLMTVLALRLDRTQAEARRQAALEENVRLALWRMESTLSPLIAQESARPYFAYTAFYPPERAYTRMFNSVDLGEVLMPSPLLGEPPEHVLLHFQFGPDGALTSPQVPTGNMRDLAETGYVSPDQIETASHRLAALKAAVGRDGLARLLPLERPRATMLARLPQQSAGQGSPQAGQQEQSLNAQPNPQPNGQAQQPAQVTLKQVERNLIEYQRRIEQQNDSQQKIIQNTKGPGQYQNVNEGPMRPIWLGATLVLARRVVVSGQEYVQGCWLDWPSVRQWLIGEVADLLPRADVVPAVTGAPAEAGRLLAGLPVSLVPGAVPTEPTAAWSPIRLSLVWAWGCVLVAAAAVGVLLHGTLALSERRGTFVSAVTHELRTPLTTFRMYAEMLAGGMVPEEENRTRYLNTLQVEAERLSHLVENVLAYARIERGRAAGRVRAVPVGSVLDGLRGRLADRATHAGMELVFEAPDDALAAQVRCDPGAVEQILFNLVDNACKYAAGAADRRIHLQVDCGLRIADCGLERNSERQTPNPRPRAAQDNRRLVLAVCDHGPGIGRREARRLFRPFSKSARDAAHTAPGIGLGLALCRRLARAMGGDLHYAPSPSGACFLLSLPLAAE